VQWYHQVNCTAELWPSMEVGIALVLVRMAALLQLMSPTLSSIQWLLLLELCQP
jgi:hypothetical protein